MRAPIAVITRRTIGLDRIAAHAGGRITRARTVACIRGQAREGTSANTYTSGADIEERTCIAVVANGAIDFDRIRTRAGRRIARTRIVALIRRRTRDRTCSNTCARLACIRCRARAAIIACGAIGLDWIAAQTRRRVARSRIMTLIRSRT